MTPIKITIPGRPITKKNHSQIIKVHNRLMVVPSREYKTYEATAGWYIHHKGLMIKTPVQVKCLYYMPTKGRVDLGNLLAGTCDLLVHHMVLADDNSRIVASHDGSRVLYDKDNPRVEIEISEVKTIMAKKSFFMAQQEAVQREYFRCGKVTGEQRSADVFALAALECGVTRPVIRKIFEVAKQIGEETVDAFDVSNPEADVIQERVEKKLRSIFGDDFAPWNERYEYMKQVKY